MKKLLYLGVLIAIAGCTRFGQDAAEIVEPIPPYMKEVFSGNKDCRAENVIELQVGQTFYSKINPVREIYTDQSDPNFDSNFSVYSIEKENFYELFPNFIPINSTVLINSEQFTIKDIDAHVQILSHLPKGYLNNLKTGSYFLNNDPLNKTLGFKAEILARCSLKESTSYSYCITYTMDLNKPYHFTIDCIDKTDPANVKISGKFDGTFTSNENAADSKFVKGSFSTIFR